MTIIEGSIHYSVLWRAVDSQYYGGQIYIHIYISICLCLCTYLYCIWYMHVNYNEDSKSVVQGLEVGYNKPSIFQAINKHITTWQSSNEATNYQSGTELSQLGCIIPIIFIENTIPSVRTQFTIQSIHSEWMKNKQ